MSNGSHAMEETAILEAAIRHHRAGAHAEAEFLCREVLTRNPNHETAAFLAGVLALESGRPEAAAEMLSRAVGVAPDNATYWANLGEAERRVGHFDAAAASFLRAILLERGLAAPHYNLGLLLHQVGDGAGAIDYFERAAALHPPLRADVKERISDARKSAKPRPSPATTFARFASSLLEKDRRSDAIVLAQQAVALDQSFIPAHWILGSAFYELKQYEEAIASYGRIRQLDPSLRGFQGCLSEAFWRCGRIDEAIDLLREMIALRPDDAVRHSNLVYLMHFSARHDAKSVLEEARRWDSRFGVPRATAIRPHTNDRTPDRRLRIGYVSPDFYNHAQSYFLHPLLSNHDHEKFEIVLYSDVREPDDVTKTLLQYVDLCRNTAGVSEEAMADRIREDRIDILVDLTMHTGNNRLLVFARKPAPVQISWLGYPGTTGLSAIDYRITDPYLDPPGGDESLYAERSLHLPDTFWCYSEAKQDANNPLPAARTGHIRFVSLNNFCKVNDQSIALWARLLARVAGSRLVLFVPEGELRRKTLRAFERYGIAPDRLELVPFRRRGEYMTTYRSADIALDTFPYNGHTTSLDALWMGVPVVTLVGQTAAGRAGLCFAMNLGLPELVARTEDEYVEIAARLAGDLDRLAELRATLPSRMEKSPLMDAPRFARAMEAAFRTAWHRWCSHCGYRVP